MPQAAFTFIEVCIALFLLVVVIIPIVDLLSYSSQLDLQARLQTAASDAAQQQIESLRAQTFPTGNTSETAFTLPSTVTSLYPQITFVGAYSVALTGAAPRQIAIYQTQVSWHRIDTTSTTVSSVRFNACRAQ